MILTDYYRADKLTKARSRHDITASTNEYDYFESLLINKRGYNVGGLSFNLVPRPDQWRGPKTDLAIIKGSDNITSVKRPNIESNIAYGDIKGKNDGCIIVFNSDFKEVGIKTIEIYIARGAKNDIYNIWSLFTDTDRELSHEVEALIKKAVTKTVTNLDMGKGALIYPLSLC